MRRGIDWYACPPGIDAHRPLQASLAGLPPFPVQVGDEEIMLADATRLAAHARACGVNARLEVHRRRWHVFHLQAFYLRTAATAIAMLGSFARECVDGAAPAPAAAAATSPAEVPAP
ncbi:alpha/beta hydrolase fold domain-containing protein [Massilia sp. Se16.2.3]|uniref:alpha/beta hydrolase fold domain-containing protein n=1 Tax=Massilia sp. Se16.2.3 TaxID=2709303 RepID=UPI0035A6DB21